MFKIFWIQDVSEKISTSLKSNGFESQNFLWNLWKYPFLMLPKHFLDDCTWLLAASSSGLAGPLLLLFSTVTDEVWASLLVILFLLFRLLCLRCLLRLLLDLFDLDLRELVVVEVSPLSRGSGVELQEKIWNLSRFSWFIYMMLKKGCFSKTPDLGVPSQVCFTLKAYHKFFEKGTRLQRLLL